MRVAAAPTTDAPDRRPTSPAVRISASACARFCIPTMLEACAVGAEPSSVPPMDHRSNTATACGTVSAKGKMAMALALVHIAGASTRPGPTLSASHAEGAAPATETADWKAKRPPICGGIGEAEASLASQQLA
eukprot:6177304-Pleurochrysis_carterae.AAC.2